jgi:hypothetical protein
VWFLGPSGVPELPRSAVSLWRAVVQGDPAADVTSPCSSSRNFISGLTPLVFFSRNNDGGTRKGRISVGV